MLQKDKEHMMSIERLDNFSTILNSLNFPLEDESLKEQVSKAKTDLSAHQDTIQLSIQAQKVFNQKQPEVGQDEMAALKQVETKIQIDEQGNRLQISSLGSELAFSQGAKIAWETPFRTEKTSSPLETPKNEVGTATLDSGTKVSIYTTQITRPDEKSSMIGANEKVIAEITKVDGSTEMFTIDSNTVISEDNNGQLIILNDSSSELNGTAKNDIIINLTGITSINCGDGNDTIISFNNIDNINLGGGDNSFYSSSNAITSNISAGNGKNSIKISNESIKTNINLGDGNNNIESFSAISLDAGSGNNVIYIHGSDNLYSDSSISLGDGDNQIDISGKLAFIKDINIGHGNNKISIGSFVSNSMTIGNGNNDISMGRAFGKGNINPLTGQILDYTGSEQPISLRYTKINIGDGNNSLDFFTLYGQINLGNGDNNISSYRSIMPSFITLGDGSNTLTSSNLNISSLTFGNGDNYLKSEHLGGNISFGDGNNTVNSESLYMGRLLTGNGNNSFEFQNIGYGIMYFGSGNDLINIHGNINQQTYINLGNGNDNITIDGDVNNLTLITGNGNDNITIQGDVVDSKIVCGPIDGKNYTSKDRINIYKNMYNSSILSRNIIDEVHVNGQLIDSTIDTTE